MREFGKFGFTEIKNTQTGDLYLYNEDGFLIFQRESNSEMEIKLDKRGNIINERYKNSDEEFESEYDESNRLIKQISKGALAPCTTLYEYDEMSRIVKETTHFSDKTLIIENEYDERGNCITKRNSSNGIETYKYDQYNRVIYSEHFGELKNWYSYFQDHECQILTLEKNGKYYLRNEHDDINNRKEVIVSDRRK
jgi:YD repeat-containing protein